MQITESHMLYLAGLVILFCGISLLPFKVHTRHSWVLYLPVIPVLFYLTYEILMITKFATINIRIDLLVIGLFLISIIRKTIYRWEQVNPSAESSTSRLAQSCFGLGLVSIILYQLLVFSVAAIVIGHIAQIRAWSKHRFVGKQLVNVGLGIGYVNLGLAMFGLFAM